MKLKGIATGVAVLLASAIAAPASAAVTYGFSGLGQTFTLQTADYVSAPAAFTQFTTSSNVTRAEFCFTGQTCFEAFRPTTSALAVSSGNDTYFYYFSDNTFTMNGTTAAFQFANPGTLIVSGSATPATPAVPEPATWAMMLLGFSVVGFGMRYSMRKSNAKFDLKVKRIAAGLEA